MTMHLQHFEESKIKTLKVYWWIIVIILVLYTKAVYSTVAELGFSSKTLLFVLSPILLIIVVFICLPTVKLRLDENGFKYKKGRKEISAQWVDVTHIAIQSRQSVTRGYRTLGGIDIFIKTKDDTTGLIPVKCLKKIIDQNSSGVVYEKDFVEELERLSNKKVLIGDMSIGYFSKATFDDYDKGNS